MPSLHRRGPWSQTEDSYLMSLVASQGALNWVRISQLLTSRTPKQCRERYHQNLKPTLNHDPITPEEGLQIERLVHEIGKRWAEIARRLHGRSDNAVKNWWNGSQNRRKRIDRRKATHLGAYGDASGSENAGPFRRTAVDLQRALPLPALSRAAPPALPSPGFPPRGYCVETPLPSPSALTPGSDHEMTPSLMSDNGSYYSTSPRGTDIPHLSVELPPLKNIGNMSSPRISDSPTDTKLPALSAVTSPLFSKSENTPCLPPMQRTNHLSPKQHLLTAPNSPVNLPALRVSQSACPSQAADRDTRMKLSVLLR